MSADTIQVYYEQLDAIAAQFGNQAEQTAQLYQDIQRRVEQLRQGGWVGVAADAFYYETDAELLPAVRRLI